MKHPGWKTDGIVGDRIFRHRGKLYKLATVRGAKSFSGMPDVKRRAQKWAGKDGRVLKLFNTYSYAVYSPYKGDERPKKR